jgi:hypothetical protein
MRECGGLLPSPARRVLARSHGAEPSPYTLPSFPRRRESIGPTPRCRSMDPRLRGGDGRGSGGHGRESGGDGREGAGGAGVVGPHEAEPSPYTLPSFPRRRGAESIGPTARCRTMDPRLHAGLSHMVLLSPLFSSVIPAKAGIHSSTLRCSTMDAGFRRHDDKKRSPPFSYTIALPSRGRGEVLGCKCSAICPRCPTPTLPQLGEVKKEWGGGRW